MKIFPDGRTYARTWFLRSQTTTSRDQEIYVWTMSNWTYSSVKLNTLLIRDHCLSTAWVMRRLKFLLRITFWQWRDTLSLHHLLVGLRKQTFTVESVGNECNSLHNSFGTSGERSTCPCCSLGRNGTRFKEILLWGTLFSYMRIMLFDHGSPWQELWGWRKSRMTLSVAAEDCQW